MKTFSRTAIIRVSLLVSAMGGAYFVGRVPGSWAKWEGHFPPIWRKLISRTWVSPEVIIPVEAHRNVGDPDALLAVNAVMDQLAKILAMDTSFTRKELDFQRVMMRLNPSDRTALFNKLSDLPEGWRKKTLISALIGSLLNPQNDGPRDPKLALSLSKQVENNKLRQELIKSALESLTTLEPVNEGDFQLAMDELAKLPASDVGSDLSSLLFQDWAKLNPAAAEAAAARLPPGRARDQAIYSVVESLPGDTRSVFSWLQSLPPGDSIPWDEVVDYFAGMDPRLAMANLDKIKTISGRAAAVRDIFSFELDSATGGDPKAALEWARQNVPGQIYNDAVDAYISDLNSGPHKDSAIAAEMVENISDPLVRFNEVTHLAAGWGAKDPKAALAWASNLTEAGSVTRSDTLRSVVSSWATSDPAAAVAYIQGTSDPSLYLPLAPTIAQIWAGSAPPPVITGPLGAWTSSDPAAAITWVNSLPDSDEKNQALGNVLTGLAKTDFTAAWNDAANLPPGDNQNTILANLIATRAAADPVQAATLLGQLPAGPAQLDAMTKVAATWVKQDPQAFTAWLNGLPAGDVRDTAIGQLVASTQAGKNPNDVAAWVNTVSNPEMKAVMVQKLNQVQSAGK